MRTLKSTWPGLVILLIYLAVGTLYAMYTPIWQAPDEPAHYNYIRSLAEGRGIPVMEAGDYDQDYLDRLRSEGFPPELSIDEVEYEDHQPPLYYILGTIVFTIFGPSVRWLRLFSLLLGAVGVAMIFMILREFWPSQPGLTWLGGGIAAFIPQYIAITASVNNDALLFALLWLWLWMALRYLRGQISPWALGVVAGAVLLTKSTGYGVLLLAPLTVYLRYRRGGMSLKWTVNQLVALFLPALLLGGVWWMRNVVVYGWPDFLGLMQHDAVVVNQPETGEWIAQQGFLPFLIDATWTTFRSFWGQFGWMGVVLDARIYQALAIFTALTIYGAFWRLFEALDGGMDPRQRDALIVLATSAFITVALYVGYNLTFVQHQGRYLFPALPLFALAIALGWERLVRQRLAVTTAMGLLFILVVLGVTGLVTGDPALWPMILLALTIVGLPLLAFLPERWYGLAIVMALLGMVVLDLWSLFGFIVPILTT